MHEESSYCFDHLTQTYKVNEKLYDKEWALRQDWFTANPPVPSRRRSMMDHLDELAGEKPKRIDLHFTAEEKEEMSRAFQESYRQYRP